MNKKLIVRYVFMAISVTLMALIFFFSAQNGGQSSGISNGFSNWLAEILQFILPSSAVELITGNIRKLAHVFVYACLGVSVSVFVFTFQLRHGWLFFVIPLVVCFLYACCDEAHQLFVPGREGSFIDVLIDAIGFVSATLICNFIRLIRDKKKKGCNR